MLESPKNAWFDLPQISHEHRLVAVCFPHAGGASTVFQSWKRLAPAGVLVLPVRLPGREQRLLEAPAAELAPLVAEIGLSLTVLGEVPTLLVGHSVGALIAFELARWRRKNGLPTHGLLAAGCTAPQFLPRSMARRPVLHQLPDADLIFQIQTRYGGLPDIAARNAELMSLLLPALRADVKLVETYEYVTGPPLECPIWAFGGSDDPEVPPADLAAWRSQTSSAFSHRLFPGGHFFLGSAQSAILDLFRQQAAQAHAAGDSENPSQQRTT